MNKYNKDGKIIDKIILPVSCITSCVFGGDNLNILFITTSSFKLNKKQNIQEPYQRVAFVSDIQSGVPSASQQRIAQTRAPQPSPLGQAVGTGIGAYAAFTGG